MRHMMAAAASVSVLALAFTPAHSSAQGTSGQMSSPPEKSGAAQPSMMQKMERQAESVATDVTDSWVTAKVKIALFADERVKGHHVNVSTTNGTVWLRGKVDSEAAKAAAADISRGVEHVKGAL